MKRITLLFVVVLACGMLSAQHSPAVDGPFDVGYGTHWHVYGQEPKPAKPPVANRGSVRLGAGDVVMFTLDTLDEPTVCFRNRENTGDICVEWRIVPKTPHRWASELDGKVEKDGWWQTSTPMAVRRRDDKDLEWVRLDWCIVPEHNGLPVETRVIRKSDQSDKKP